MTQKKINKTNLFKEIAELKTKRLIAITAIEESAKFVLLYHFDGKKILNLMIELGKKNPEINSIIAMFPGANIYECEIHDLFGIEFKDNPNLDHKLFLADDFKEKPPLLRRENARS